MYRFFAMIDRLGVSNTVMAQKMGISVYAFRNVRAGVTQPSEAFRQGAERAFRAMAIRDERGAFYGADALFERLDVAAAVA